MSNPIKPTIKTEFFSLAIIILTLAASVFFYNNLPERIATHWNFAGEADGWGSGPMQAIIFPLIIIGTYLIFVFIPYLDPKKERYEQFNRVYHIFKNIILTLLVIVYFLMCLNGLGYNLPVGIIMPILIGLLFIIMGNYMAKLKQNWFIGVKTPWTLSSEEVWNKTHRVGGKMFILAGLLMMAQVILPNSWKLAVFITTMLILLVGTIGYSYIAYFQEKKKK